MNGFTCAPGFEATLAAELGPGARVAGPGLVLADGGADPAFAWQALPDARTVEGASIAALARAAFDALADPLDGEGPWALHVAALGPGDEEERPKGRGRYAPGPRREAASDDARPESGARRAALVEAALLERFHEKRRRTDRRRVAGDALPIGGRLAQLLLTGPGAALASVAPVRAVEPFGLAPDPRWPLGRREVPDDEEAPSSAYRKAEEAYLLLGAAPAKGERVVDLGGAPGGWTWTAVRRGALVTAVDRADLHERLLRLAHVDARRGDAFAFEPEQPVDWLLCDVIATPDRSLKLLDRWLARGWCRRFVVQLKLKGDESRLPVLALARALLAKRRAAGRVLHLVHGKNELTALGRTAT